VGSVIGQGPWLESIALAQEEAIQEDTIRQHFPEEPRPIAESRYGPVAKYGMIVPAQIAAQTTVEPAGDQWWWILNLITRR
jgi:hypothetical protein